MIYHTIPYINNRKELWEIRSNNFPYDREIHSECHSTTSTIFINQLNKNYDTFPHIILNLANDCQIYPTFIYTSSIRLLLGKVLLSKSKSKAISVNYSLLTLYWRTQFIILHCYILP